MKKIYYVFIMLLINVFTNSCQNNDDVLQNQQDQQSDTKSVNDLIIGYDSKIESPEWLAYTVDTVVQRYKPNEKGEYPDFFVTVYKVDYNGYQYYLVEDEFESCGASAQLVFTEDGIKIDYTTDLYDNIIKNGTRSLVWDHRTLKVNVCTNIE